MKAYRRRYLFLVVNSKEKLDCENIFREIKSVFESFFGLSNLYLSRLKLEWYDEGRLIISVNSIFLKETVAAVTLVGRGRERKFTLTVTAVAETIKRLREKI